MILVQDKTTEQIVGLIKQTAETSSGVVMLRTVRLMEPVSDENLFDRQIEIMRLQLTNFRLETVINRSFADVESLNEVARRQLVRHAPFLEHLGSYRMSVTNDDRTGDVKFSINLPVVTPDDSQMEIIFDQDFYEPL